MNMTRDMSLLLRDLEKDLLVTNVEFFFTSHVELDIYYVGWLVFEKKRENQKKARKNKSSEDLIFFSLESANEK